MNAVTLNPVEGLAASGLADFLRAVCCFGLSEPERRQMDDQIDALAPALTELRDAGHLDLNIRAISRYATLDGFSQLAQDERLSSQAREQCGEVHARLVARGVHAMLIWGIC